MSIVDIVFIYFNLKLRIVLRRLGEEERGQIALWIYSCVGENGRGDILVTDGYAYQNGSRVDVNNRRVPDVEHTAVDEQYFLPVILLVGKNRGQVESRSRLCRPAFVIVNGDDRRCTFCRCSLNLGTWLRSHVGASDLSLKLVWPLEPQKFTLLPFGSKEIEF